MSGCIKELDLVKDDYPQYFKHIEYDIRLDTIIMDIDAMMALRNDKYYQRYYKLRLLLGENIRMTSMALICDNFEFLSTLDDSLGNSILQKYYELSKGNVVTPLMLTALIGGSGIAESLWSKYYKEISGWTEDYIEAGGTRYTLRQCLWSIQVVDELFEILSM